MAERRRIAGPYPVMGSRGLRRRAILGAALAIVALVGACHVALLAWVFAGRVGYPLDLEWMEGGTLTHALRLIEGRGIYVEPSVEFIPFLYTPLYPAVLAALGRVVGLSYALGRGVSIACFAAAVAIAVRAARREGAPWPFAIAGAGAIAAAFPHVEGFYDLVRVDSLHLALVAGGAYALRHHHGSARGVAAAAALFALGFWAKQTAALFLLAGGVALLLLNWRLVWVYVLVAGLIDGVGVLVGNAATDGWLWRVVFELHQHHTLYWGRLYLTPWRMFLVAPLVVALPLLWPIVAGATRRVPRGALYWAWMALAGIEVSAVSFATQWAVRNACMPGYYFCGLFLAVGAADLWSRLADRRTAGALGAAGVAALVAAQLGLLVYPAGRYVPSDRARAEARRFVGRLRALAAEGDLLVPYHPWYPVLVGGRPHFHQMGVNDITRAGMRAPPSILEALREGRYAAVVLDRDAQPHYGRALGDYERTRLRRGETPRTLHGFKTRPALVLRRRAGAGAGPEPRGSATTGPRAGRGPRPRPGPGARP